MNCEWLGYVKKGKYERILQEKDELRLIVAKLETEIEGLLRIMKVIRPPALTLISGIGVITAEQLQTIGIKDVKDLANASPNK